MSETRTLSATKPRTRKSPLLPALLAVLAAAVLVIGFVGLPGDEDDASAQDAQSGASASQEIPADDPLMQLPRRDPDDPRALGDVDAPVVMVNYSEFQCPFCGKFARDTAPTLIEKYVADGTLRIEWRDFPYLGQESMTAALAGAAAAEQGKFWEFHDALFDQQLPPNSGNLDQEYVETKAAEVGLDVAAFRAAMDATVAERRVALDFREGQTIGVSGTPAFVINGVPVMGAQPTEVFEEVIEQAAAQ